MRDQLAANLSLESSRGEMTNNRVPNRQSSLSNQLLDILIEKIRDGSYPINSLFPSEHQLANEYRVSRATVRSAFDRLEAMGLILRRQGVGTFARYISNISNPLNQFIDFIDLIRQNGFEPGFRQISAEIIDPTPKLANFFQLEAGCQVMHAQKVWLADGAPIIYCENYIPAWVFQDLYSNEQVLQPGFTEPILDFYENKCGQHVQIYLASVRADNLHHCGLPGLFDRLESSTPVLVIEETGYNAEDRPVHHSIEYHPGNRMEFKLIRSI
jgi:GntR family transcriptional regulator